MNFLYYIFIFLLSSFDFADSYWYSNDLNRYLKLQQRNSDEFNRKFGSPRDHVFRLMPLYYQQKSLQYPSCLPTVWTCGPGLPPCCPGLMCYDGNAKRGRYCVAKG
jgi:hypothetical protein